MRQHEAKLNSLNIAGKPVSVLVLEVNREFDTGAKRQVNRVVRVHDLHAVDVGDEDVEHSDLVWERLAALLYDHGDLAVLVEGLDCFVVHDLHDRRCCFFRLEWVGGVVVFWHDWVAYFQLSVDIGVNENFGVWRNEVHVRAFWALSAELVDFDLKLLGHLHSRIPKEPVLVAAILLRVVNRNEHLNKSVTFIPSSRIDAWWVEWGREQGFIIFLSVVPHVSGFLGVFWQLKV